MQPYALALAVVQDRDRVAVADAPHTAGEVGGEGVTGKQRKAKEQRQGSNRLGTAHGISGTVRTASILRESGRKGESGEWRGAVERSRAPKGSMSGAVRVQA